MYSASLLCLLLVAGCAMPKEVQIETGSPRADALQGFETVVKGRVGSVNLKAQYTLLEQLSPTAPIPKNGYASRIVVSVEETVRGDKLEQLELFVVDPTKKGIPPWKWERARNVAVGDTVHVGLKTGKPVMIWIDLPDEPHRLK